ncbi:MAG: hypothetical protein ACLUOI_05430 [Eisenbergiella sp.]
MDKQDVGTPWGRGLDLRMFSGGGDWPTIFRCIMKKSCEPAGEGGYDGSAGLNGAEENVFDKAQLMLFFLYLNVCVRDSLILQGESVHHELVQKVNEYIEAHMSEAILLEAGGIWCIRANYFRGGLRADGTNGTQLSE